MRWASTILILLAGLFVLLLAFAISLDRDGQRRLWAEGAMAEGTVTGVTGTKGTHSKYYSYAFSAGGHEQTRTRRHIPWSARNTPIGSKVAVRYDPKDPSRSITQAELDESESWGNRFVFPLIGALLVAWALLRIFRPRRAPPPAASL